MKRYPNATAPLGPVIRHAQTAGGRDASYYLDQTGNEYTGPGHIGLCAVAKALDVQRGRK